MKPNTLTPELRNQRDAYWRSANFGREDRSLND